MTDNVWFEIMTVENYGAETVVHFYPLDVGGGFDMGGVYVGFDADDNVANCTFNETWEHYATLVATARDAVRREREGY